MTIEVIVKNNDTRPEAVISVFMGYAAVDGSMQETKQLDLAGGEEGRVCVHKGNTIRIAEVEG